MSATPADNDRPKKTGIQVDLYGIKVEGITPRPGKEPAPESWREVARGANLDLMRFCAQTVKLLADIPTAVGAIVRGIGQLPGAISRRVGRAHDKADRALAGATPEPGAIAVAVAEADSPPTPKEGLAELEDSLNELIAQGVQAILTRLPTGQWAVLLGTEELQPHLKVAAVKAVGGEVLSLAPPAPPLPLAFEVIPVNAPAKQGGGPSPGITLGVRPHLTASAVNPAAGIILESGSTVEIRPYLTASSAMPLSEVGLPPAVVKKLGEAGYQKLGQVHAAGPANVAAIVGIGPKSFRAIEAALARHDLEWPAGVAPSTAASLTS